MLHETRMGVNYCCWGHKSFRAARTQNMLPPGLWSQPLQVTTNNE